MYSICGTKPVAVVIRSKALVAKYKPTRNELGGDTKVLCVATHSHLELKDARQGVWR
jgi:hypothetical protein